MQWTTRGRKQAVSEAQESCTIFWIRPVYRELCWDILQQAGCAESAPCKYYRHSIQVDSMQVFSNNIASLKSLKGEWYITYAYGSDPLINNWKDSPASMLPVYTKLIAAGLRIWVFRCNHINKIHICKNIKDCLVNPSIYLHCSGDTDAVVPVTATKLSLSHLNLRIKTPWYPWYVGGQVN